MLRNKNLVPLSHQHQHALAMCVRLKRALQAGEVDMEAWQAELAQFELEIAVHFAAEEKELFPRAGRLPEMQSLVEELKDQHEALRELFSGAQKRRLDRCALGALQAKLTAHIRKEERELFEGMQNGLGADEMQAIGAALERALAKAVTICALPGAQPS